MLTVFREMAHSLARQLAHLEADKQRLGRDVAEEQQDAVLAEVLERAIEDGERAVARTPEQLEVLRESGVVDAGGHGLVLILAGVVAGLRGEDARAARGRPPRAAAAQPAPPRGQPLPLLHQLHRLRQRPRQPRVPAAAGGARRLGPGRRRRGDAEGPRPHRRARGGGGALRGRRRGDQPRRRRHARADGRARARGWPAGAPASSRWRPGRASSGSSPSSAPTSSPAARRSTPRPTSCWPGSTASAAEEVLVLPSSSNVIMAAERACELSEKPARVVPATSQQASLLALVELDPAAALRGERRAPRGGAGRRRHRRRRPGRPRRRPGPLQAGRRGRLRRRRDRRLGRGRVDPDPDDPAPRRGSRDRHRDRRRGGADPARPRSTPTCPTGSRSRPTREASRAGGGCSRRSRVRVFAGAGELSRAELREAPVHWPRPERSRGVDRGPRRRRAETRRSGAPRRGSRPSATSSYRFPHSHRDRQIRPSADLEQGETGTVLVEVLGSPAAPLPQTAPDDRRRQSRRRERTGAGHLVQPALGRREARPRGAGCCSPGSSSGKGFGVNEWELVVAPKGEEGERRARSFVPGPFRDRGPAAAADPRLGGAGLRLAPERDRGAAGRAAGAAAAGLGSATAIRPPTSPESPEELEEARRAARLRRALPPPGDPRDPQAQPPSARPAPRFGRPRASWSSAGSSRCRSSRPATSATPSPTSTPTSTRASRCSGC